MQMNGLRYITIVTLQVSFVFSISGKKFYADLGGNATLSCPLTVDEVVWHGIGGYQLSQGTQILSSLPKQLRERLSILVDDSSDLHIKAISATDEGDYTCSDKNETVSLSLVIKAAPTYISIINEYEGFIITDEDKSVTITCEAIGGQPPPYLSIYWKLDQMVTGVGSKLKITIKPQRKDHFTNLTCIANHTLMHDVLVATATLKLNRNRVISNDNEVRYGDIGGNVTLPCPFHGNSVTWHGIGGYQYSQGATILSSLPPNLRERLSVSTETKDSDMLIERVESTDEGTYTCTGQNGTALVTLMIIVPPEHVYFVNESDNMLVIDENEPVNITCESVGGQPPPTLSLYWKETKLTTGIGPLIIFTINPLRLDDFTNVTCTANHTHLQDDLITTATLQLNLIPVTMSIRGETVLYEGKGTTISCSTTGSRPPTIITWFVNNKYVNATRIENTVSTDGTYEVNSILEFIPDRTHNKRMISCLTFNRTSKYTISKELEVEVYFPPSLIIESKEINGVWSLRCIPDGNPKIYEFLDWRHSSFFSETIRQLKGNQSGIIEITRDRGMVYEKSGIYTCFVKNGIPDINGDLVKNSSFHLQFEGRPMLTSNNILKYHWTAGREVVIAQKYVSYPEPTHEAWYRFQSGEKKTLDSLKYTTFSLPAIVLNVHFGKTIHVYGHISILSIKDMSIDDPLDYILVIENQVGIISTLVSLEQNTEGSTSHEDSGSTAIAIISVGSVLLVMNAGCFILNIKYRRTTKRKLMVYSESNDGNEESATVLDQLGIKEENGSRMRSPRLSVTGDTDISVLTDDRYVPEHESGPVGPLYDGGHYTLDGSQSYLYDDHEIEASYDYAESEQGNPTDCFDLNDADAYKGGNHGSCLSVSVAYASVSYHSNGETVSPLSPSNRESSGNIIVPPKLASKSVGRGSNCSAFISTRTLTRNNVNEPPKLPGRYENDEHENQSSSYYDAFSGTELDNVPKLSYNANEATPIESTDLDESGENHAVPAKKSKGYFSDTPTNWNRSDNDNIENEETFLKVMV